MRTRSQPVSPGGLVSLEDVPRRRRTTRSASAQPQEPEFGRPTAQSQLNRAAPKGRPARGKKVVAAPRAKKTTRRKTVASNQTTPSELEPAKEDIVDGAGNGAEHTMEKVEEPPVVIEQPQEPSAIIEHPQESPVVIEHPQEPPVVIEHPQEPPVVIEHSQEPPVVTEHPQDATKQPGVVTQDEPSESIEPNANENMAEQSRPAEQIAQSIETDAEPAADADMEDCELTEFVPHAPSEIRIVAPSRPWGLGLLRNPFSRHELNGAVDYLANWTRQLWEHLKVTALAGRTFTARLLDTPMIPSLNRIHELTIGAAGRYSRLFRNRHQRPRSPPRFSGGVPAAPSPARGSQVLGPQQATPIRRSRFTYFDISRRRRTEANGRLDHTLYRLPDLLAQNEVNAEAPTSDRQQIVATEGAGSSIARPVTPERAPLGAPMTAPAAGATTAPSPESSPSWSRWIFNSVSRRWTNIRDRLGARPAEEREAPQAGLPTPVAEVNPAASTPTPASPSAETIAQEQPLSTVGESTTPTRRARSSSRTRTRKPTRSYTLFSPGYSQEVLDGCYRRTTSSGPASNKKSQISQSAETSQATQTSSTEEDESKKRKRPPSPDQIPNPPGCSYGMHDDYFTFTEEEEAFLIEEAARKAAEAEKKALAESAPPVAKKQRVNEPQQRRRLATTRQTTVRPTTSTVSASLQSPSKRPGFVPNARQTYQVPELSPIESAGSLSDINSSNVAQPQAANPNTPTTRIITNPHGTFRTPGWFSSSDDTDSGYEAEADAADNDLTDTQINTPAVQTHHAHTSDAQSTRVITNPHGTFRTPGWFSSSSSSGEDTVDPSPCPNLRQHPHRALESLGHPSSSFNEEPLEALINPALTDSINEAPAPDDDPSPLSRARNKAEQFKPKTPSRLREAHRFSSSTTSVPSPSFVGAITSTPFYKGDPASYLASPLGDSMSLDNSSVAPNPKWIKDDWLYQVCPTGDLCQLHWPVPAGLTEDRAPDSHLTQLLDEKKAENAVGAWQTLTETA
ncbi:uncharacterized protein N7459_008519 [Penicillium hispanicum]|uniref:uncharacterized protein n=1 Tax=Penicillium hispanicum TaxID=1080232 RepID=UPI00253F8640|nr:uncharacterized protein N7459_008519 [Penicillium hispanicum]KAJ5574092.1 hypothetical protein N7459_008519 [Penicillium hispanicum]